jgi:hypothetical protein
VTPFRPAGLASSFTTTGLRSSPSPDRGSASISRLSPAEAHALWADLCECGWHRASEQQVTQHQPRPPDSQSGASRHGSRAVASTSANIVKKEQSVQPAIGHSVRRSSKHQELDFEAVHVSNFNMKLDYPHRVACPDTPPAPTPAVQLIIGRLFAKWLLSEQYRCAAGDFSSRMRISS